MKIRLACAAVAVVCLFGPARLSADEIIDWNNILLDAVRTNSMSPLPTTRISAAMNTAMYDAVNSIARTHQPYHVDMTADPGTSREAAAAQAAHRVLSGMVPASQASYDAALANSLSSVPDGPGKTAGIALGNTVGAAILALRANDGASAVVPYTPGSATRRLEADSTSERRGSRPAMGQRDPVGHDQPLPVSESRRSTRFGQRRIHGRLQPGERDRLCHQQPRGQQDQSNIAQFWAGPSGHLHSRLGTGTGLLRRLPSPRVTRWRRTRGCLHWSALLRPMP